MLVSIGMQLTQVKSLKGEAYAFNFFLTGRRISPPFVSVLGLFIGVPEMRSCSAQTYVP